MNEIKFNRKYAHFFKTAFCSDECFFQTIIGNSEFYKQVKGYLTYTDWSVNPGPAMINQDYLPLLKAATGKFFARKFNDDSIAIINIIDEQLRGKPVVAESKIDNK